MTKSDRGAVVVTGASTGIGAACAQYLSEQGFRVFAGVRKQADAEAILGRKNPQLQPLILDVTQSDKISDAVQTLQASLGGSGLSGLVNNAGISYDQPLECVPIASVRHQMEVNVIGTLAVTQAFLPMVRQARGRIVTIGSLSGRLANPISGPYCMSKFAIEAFADCLRRELEPWGIHVSLIEPGAIKTAIWEKNDAYDWRADASPEHLSLYGAMYGKFRKSIVKSTKNAISCDKVSEAILHALTAPTPRTRYLVGPDARMLARLAHILPDRMLDSILKKSMESA
jgi:NAD(P)-dependent dehydrogenase (short-subunit alcohol dehydrogenase family)